MRRRPTDPIIVTYLYPEMRAAGVHMLRSLTPEEWQLPPVCPGWSVHDVALHILGGLHANISRRRDGHPGNFGEFAPAGEVLDDDRRLVQTLNAWNEAWVLATRRLSPVLTTDLINGAGRRFERYIRTLDLLQPGDAVGWAGPDPAPVWLDVAREYTEVWSHLAQIREATGRDLLDAPHLFAPVIAAFAWGIPPALSHLDRPDGTALRVVVPGEAGGEWWIALDSGRWRLFASGDAADATVETDAETFWRLGTKSLDPQDARGRVAIEGDEALGEAFLDLVAILA